MKPTLEENYHGHHIQVFWQSKSGFVDGGYAFDYSITIDAVDRTQDVRELSNIEEREKPELLLNRAKQVIDHEAA